MGSAIPSAERDRAAVVRAMRRKQDEMRRKRLKARRWLKKARVITSVFYFHRERWLLSDAITGNKTTRWFQRAVIKWRKVFPGAHGLQSYCWRRGKWTGVSAENNQLDSECCPDEPWVYRDQQFLIKMRVKLSKRKEAVRKTLIRIHALMSIDNNLFSKYSSIPIDHTLSLKILEYVNYFRLYFEEVNFENQFAFAIIEFKIGEPELIGPFTPDICHTEDKLISAIKEFITKNKDIINERQIERILNFTNRSPCLGRKKHDPCIIQLSNFSEEMNNTYNIKVHNIYSDIFGATGSNIFNEVMDLSRDHLIKNIIQLLKETINKEHSTSKFIFSQINQVQKKKNYILHYVLTEVKKITDKKCQHFLSSLKSFSVEFPSDPKTLVELKKFGEQQADKMKEHVKQIFKGKMKNTVTVEFIEENCEEFSEKISENIRSFFHHKWCELVDNEYLFNEEYEEINKEYKVKELQFKHLKLCDVINTSAVNFAYNDIKAFTNNFILKRVEGLRLE